MSYLLFLLFIFGCSFKPSEKSTIAQSEIQSKLDSDGDQLVNKMDEQPYIADIPMFRGEMLEEIKINPSFYNRALDKFEHAEFVIKSEDEDSVIKRSGSYTKNIAEDVSAYAERSQNNLVIPLSREDLNLFSAPIIADGIAHNFMSITSDYESKGYFLDSVDFEIRNRIHFQSERFKNFRDLILEVYFYDYQTKKMEFLDSFKNTGSFEFNKDHLLDIGSIKTRNIRIMDNSVLKAGKFLFVKIKDFYLPDLKINYSDLLKEVQKKSIPIVLNSPEGFETFYVGVDGRPTDLKEVIQKSLKDSFEIDENRFIKYKEFPVGEYRQDTAEGERINVQSKWHIVTNEINNNPFSYSFLPSDIIVLNYSRSTDPVFIAKNVASAFCETKKETVLKGEGLVPAKTRKIKLILSNLVTDEPYIAENFIKKATCDGQGRRCIVGNVTYRSTNVQFRKEPIYSNDSRFESFLKNTIFEVDGFEYPFHKLITEKKFSLDVDKEGKIIIESNESFIKSLKGFGAETLRFSVFHRRAQKQIEVGTYLSSCECGGMCGGPGRDIGCSEVRDFGSVSKEPFYLDYSFYSSVFIF